MLLFVNLDTAKQRYATCKSCEHFEDLIKTCNRCNCFMIAKVTFSSAHCPENKWGQAPGSEKAEYTDKDFR